MYLSNTLRQEDRVPKHLTQGVSTLLEALGRRYVAYYPALADLTGSPKAALMLGHAMYMTRTVMEKHPGRKGWFWKTANEWRQITGLSVRELETARKLLTNAEILHEERRGMPSKLWFKVDLNRLSYLLCEYANTAYRPWSWEDRVLKTLLGKPVMFYAPFAWVSDSAMAGLYMSHLFNRMRQSIAGNEVGKDGWFNSPILGSLKQLHFGRKALMNARGKLVSAGLMEEARENRMQAHLLSRILLTTIPDKIALEASKFHSLSDSDNQECRNPTIKSCPKRESRVSETANQEFPEAQIKKSPFRDSCSAERATHTYKEINTTYQHQQAGLVVDKENSAPTPWTPSKLELIYPEKLLPQEREAIRLTLQADKVEHDAQAILDELAGQMADGHVKSPIGYLRGLIREYKASSLIPEKGPRVEAERKRRQAMLEERKQQAMSPQRTERVTPEQARKHLSSIRENLWGKK